MMQTECLSGGSLRDYYQGNTKTRETGAFEKKSICEMIGIKEAETKVGIISLGPCVTTNRYCSHPDEH